MADRAFLTAEWRRLLMVNYAVEPALLAPCVPAGTELDDHRGTCYLSLVAFQNLRCSVRRDAGGERCRAVVLRPRRLLPERR